jgi:hypothetical protein
MWSRSGVVDDQPAPPAGRQISFEVYAKQTPRARRSPRYSS